jgi:phosphate-selective porin OprO/OprP
MKEPFSLETLTSDRFTTFMERALPEAFAPDRNTGLLVERNFLGERIYFGAGAFANTNDTGFAFENGSNYNTTARLTGLPIFADGGAQVLHVGLSYGHQFRGDGSLQYQQRPESHLAPRIVDTGSLAGVSGADLVGGELAGVFGPLNFQAEIMSSFLDRNPGLTNPSFWGAYGQASYFLTGETRNYNAETAVFSRTVPKHPFSISNGTWGAWEIAVRFSHIDLTNGNVRGGIANDITGGLNWYPYGNMRVLFNYVHSNLAGVGNASIVQSRVQVDF